MNVRFGNVRNPQAILLRQRKVRINVAFGVNYDGFSGFLASNQVASLRQRFIINMLKKHGLFWLVSG